MNFRNSYYEKVLGEKVEEKKSLEILLRENPVNRSKLKQFCLRFSVPGLFREVVWCFVLEIYPVYVDSKEYVLTQKRASYNDLKRALKVMGYIDEKTPKSKVFYAMYLLEKRATISNNLPQDSTFVKIAESLLGIFEENNCEAYFITKKFHNFALQIENDLQNFIKITDDLLQKNDKELYNHFTANDIFSKIPFDRLYPTMFCGIIADTALIRIFDRLVGGASLKIVIFLFLVICDVQRLNLLSKTSEKAVIKIIETSIYNPDDKSIEKSDVVVNKTIDLYKKYKDFPSKHKIGD